jgi:hypothetical protein
VLLALALAVLAAAVARGESCSEHFCLEGQAAGAERLLPVLEREYAALPDLPPRVRVALHPDFDDFRRGSKGTGRHAARWTGWVLHLAPLARLEELGLLDAVVRHELTHLWIHRASRGHAPKWLAEGICVWRAGELEKPSPADEAPSLQVEGGPKLTYRQAGEWVKRWEADHGRGAIEKLLGELAEKDDLAKLIGNEAPGGPREAGRPRLQ